MKLPTEAGDSVGLSIVQLWESEKGIRPCIKHNFLKFPLGRTVFVPSREWVTYHIPWAVKGNLFRVSFHCCFSRPHFLMTLSVTDSGQLRVHVFNTTKEALIIPARSYVVNMWYCGPLSCCFLPALKEKRDTIVRAVFSLDNLIDKFADIFDDTTMKITSHMKPYTVRLKECRFLCDLDDLKFSGVRTPPKVDCVVPEKRIRQELESFLAKGFIQKVNSSQGVFLTPIFFLPKTGGNKIRTLNDYRRLNAMCDTAGATFMDVRRIVQSIPVEWRVFSKLDLTNAFFSVGLDEDASKLFGFNIFNETYVWKVIPQGFAWSPIWFLERMKDIFFDFRTNIRIYADDILVGSSSEREHDVILERLFNRIRKHGLRLNRDKIILKAKKINFLGLEIKEGFFNLKDYCSQKASNLPFLSHYKQVEKMIGVLNSCRTHVKEIGILIEPLIEAKSYAQRHSRKCDSAFWDDLNKKVRTIWDVVLKKGVELSLQRDFDLYRLFVDWSGIHRGYILKGLTKEQEEVIVAVGSAKDPGVFQSSFLGELRTVQWALDSTKHLRGSTLTNVFVDNQSVVTSLNRGISAFCNDRRQARVFAWICENEHFISFHFLPGTRNQEADILSRLNNPRDSDLQVEVNPIDGDNLSFDEHFKWAHAGHFGFAKTLDNLRKQGCTVSQMGHRTRALLQRCKHCQFFGKKKITENLGDTLFSATRFNHMVGCDFVGPLPQAGPFKYLFVIVDGFSKWVHWKPFLHGNTRNAQICLHQWVELYGPMSHLVTDRASYFSSPVFERWCTARGIHHLLPPPYAHKVNGLCERTIQTLLQRIRFFIHEYHVTWDRCLDPVLDVYHNTFHRSTGFSPRELVFGFSRSGYRASNAELLEWRNKARENQLASQRQNRQRYLKVLHDTQFSIGDDVLVFDHVKANTHDRKFSPDWIGPFTLVRRLSRCTWLLRSSNNRFYEVHSDNLKKFFRDN